MKRKIDPFWGILTIALTVLGLVLCGIGAKRGALLVKTDAEPRATVETFFESVEIGKYEAAYACLDNYETLGLEHSPRTEAGRLEQTALLASYSYVLSDEIQVKGAQATQTVQLRYLDLNALEEALSAALAPDEPEAEETEEEPAEPETEDTEGEAAETEGETGAAEAAEDNVPAVDPAVELEALRQLLQEPARFYTTETLEVQLRYSEGQWRIVADPALLAALAGGRA